MINQFKQWVADLKAHPLPTLEATQEGRAVWIVMTSVCVFLLGSAMGYFQWFLEGDPCENCVYIRFSQFCILIAGVIMIVNPKHNILKVLGLALAWYGIIYGMDKAIILSGQHVASHAADTGLDLFQSGQGANACSLEPRFPLNLPLHEWFPYEFAPSGICGEDDWSLFGLNMAQYCIMSYCVFIICALPLTIAFLTKTFKARK
ncbi:disulfide bond formation protein B [Shewanella sp. 10N.286.51.B8]|uniref:disulfide bond formation protein B n=1 Tax=unclassified Shewanella TaxID=196818 RepID=UPI0026E491D3|nr:disulfide bond formation protein B [Shewanella sp. 6_MG-2023]MDO6618440.1 disulfide bond formation protein B [Shewanella sp. 6_MG-2023]